MERSRDLLVIIVDLSGKQMHRFKVPKTHRYCINDIFFRILVPKNVTFEVVLFRGVVFMLPSGTIKRMGFVNQILTDTRCSKFKVNLFI